MSNRRSSGTRLVVVRVAMFFSSFAALMVVNAAPIFIGGGAVRLMDLWPVIWGDPVLAGILISIVGPLCFSAVGSLVGSKLGPLGLLSLVAGAVSALACAAWLLLYIGSGFEFVTPFFVFCATLVFLGAWSLRSTQRPAE